ncbi:MAG: hypothetical protein COZ38_05195, partial [Rhodocyclales bacterium CG_4_10_14_3_um_filter_68_10]
DMRIAAELRDFRMPLMDGTSIPMGLPYDWYYGTHGAPIGEKAPLFIVPRIAFAGVLARAFDRSGDATYAQALHDYIVDYVSRYWLDSTELPEHDNWLCTSARGGSWFCHRFGGIREAMTRPEILATFSGTELLMVFRAIDNMMTGLIPNLALGSNWRVHELANIFTQGYLYPFLRRSGLWLEVAVNGLNEECEIQLNADGSHEEFCIDYGKGTWWVFAHFYALARQDPSLGLRFEDEQMQSSLRYFLAACKPFGLPAVIGDAYMIRTAAVLDPQAPPHPAGQAPDWDDILWRAAESIHAVAPSAESRFILEAGPPPDWRTRMNRDSGYLFMRDGWATDALYANLNMGHYANCHCHYGLLGLELAGYGREFIVDAGCSALDSRPRNANLARTRGHNTLTLDGLDQQVTVPVTTSRLFTGEHYDFAVGVYRGGYTVGNSYGPGCTSAGRYDNCFPASHFRHMLFVHGSYWIVFDAMISGPDHRVETRYHFMPTELRPQAAGGYATSWAAANMALLPLHWDGWEHEIAAGRDEPVDGWLPAPGGEMIPAPVYVASHASGGVVWHGSLLLPYPGATMPRCQITPLPTGDAGFGFRIETDDYTDLVFLSNSWTTRDVVLDDVHTNAPLLHLRRRGGEIDRAATCEGSYLRVGGHDLFRAPGTMLAREFAAGGRHTHTYQPRYKH